MNDEMTYSDKVESEEITIESIKGLMSSLKDLEVIQNNNFMEMSYGYIPYSPLILMEPIFYPPHYNMYICC